MFRCLVSVIVFTAIGFFFSQHIFDLILMSVPDEITRKCFDLPGHFILMVKLSVYFGIFFSLPVMTWQAYGFVQPALRSAENNFVKTVIFLGWLLLLTGLAFTHFALPLMIETLLGTWSFEGVVNEADILKYTSFILTIYLGFSILFQLPLLIFLSIITGLVDANFYSENRKIGIIALMLLCAIFTPPDVFSLFLVFFPVYLLFESSIFCGRFFRKV